MKMASPSLIQMGTPRPPTFTVSRMETEMEKFDRITFDINVMGGRACIRGMRVTVALILNLISNGMTAKEIIQEYPYLEEEDIRQALQYAAWLADETVQREDYLRFQQMGESEILAHFDRVWDRLAEENAHYSDDEIAADIKAA